MDNNCLRLIANPFLLKKNCESFDNKKQKTQISVNHFLYLYIEKKYPNIYIPPTIFYNIINTIDQKIIEFEIKQLLNEIINSVLIKFDKH
jgi:hypothetical protein